jgi:hypothetical protein
VVSVVEKGGGILRQVSLEETNASEPLMTCRKTQDDVETGIETWIPGARVGEMPADCPTGVRHEGGVTLRQASLRNTGTCRSRVPRRSTGAETCAVGKKVL